MVLTTSKGKSVDSPYTHQQALELLATHVHAGGKLAGNSFACDLWRKSERGLSQDQVVWVHVLVNEALNPQPRQQAQAKQGYQAIVELLVRASSKLQWPAIRLSTASYGNVKVSWNRSKSLANVTDGRPFGSNEWYGRIDALGQWVPSRSSNVNVERLLGLLAADPVGTMQAYGHSTGQCGFCGRTLSNEDRSVKVGYGPVCANKYGLPW